MIQNQLERTEDVLKTICYLSVLMLSGCKGLNDAPVKYLRVVDTRHNVCSLRQIVDKNTLSSKWIQDMPLEKCDGVIGLSSQDFLNLRTYMKGN